MNAHGSQVGISLKKESSWGVAATGQFQGINFNTADLTYNLENKESEAIRPDRQSLPSVTTGASVENGFETEFQAENVDDLLVGALFTSDWVSNDITAGPTASNLDFVFDATAKTLTLGSAVSHNVVVDLLVTIAGTSDNNGVFLATAVSGNVITFGNDVLVDETVEATATLKADYLRNGVVQNSYTIEQSFNDIGVYSLFTGMVVNEMEFTAESEEIVMMNFSFVGKDQADSTSETSSPTAISATDNPVFDSAVSVQDILIDDLPSPTCLIQSFDFTLNNQVEGKKGVGVLGFCRVKEGRIQLTGNISIYFEDLTYYNKFKNRTFFGITLILTDSEGNVYSFRLPKCKFDEMPKDVGGREEDVMLEGAFTATFGTENYTLQVTKAIA